MVPGQKNPDLTQGTRHAATPEAALIVKKAYCIFCGDLVDDKK